MNLNLDFRIYILVIKFYQFIIHNSLYGKKIKYKNLILFKLVTRSLLILIDYILFIYKCKNFAKFHKLKFIIILILDKIKGEK